MTTLYKLTDQDGYTRRRMSGETKWSPGFTLEASGKDELCSSSFVHAYTHPLLAVLLNPIHARIENPLLWEAEGDIALTDDGLKVGCTRLTTIKQIDLPVISTEQRVRFAVLCAKAVYEGPGWKKWADNWLSGADRTKTTAMAAAHAAAVAVDVASRAAARAAASSASSSPPYSSAKDFSSSPWAARAASRAASDAAWAAVNAAWAAAHAAWVEPDVTLPDAAKDFSLIEMAEAAMKE